MLPRASDEESVRQDFYRLPFPNDALRDPSGRIDFSRHPKDPAPVFGFDVLGRYLDVLASEPFSNAPSILFRFDGPLDFSSINLNGATPNLRLVKLETGQTFPHGLSVMLNGGGAVYVARGGKLYDGNEESVAGVTSEVKDNEVILTAGGGRYRIVMPK